MRQRVAELSALDLVRDGSFSVTAGHDAPLLWHERFANARQRIADWVARTGWRTGSRRGR